DVAQTELFRARSGHDDEVDPGGEQIGGEPEAFTADPLDAVAHDRVADLARDDEPEARRPRARAPSARGAAIGRLRGHQKDVVRRRHAARDGLGVLVLTPLADPAIGPEEASRAEA